MDMLLVIAVAVGVYLLLALTLGSFVGRLLKESQRGSWR